VNGKTSENKKILYLCRGLEKNIILAAVGCGGRGEPEEGKRYGECEFCKRRNHYRKRHILTLLLVWMYSYKYFLRAGNRR